MTSAASGSSHHSLEPALETEPQGQLVKPDRR